MDVRRAIGAAALLACVCLTACSPGRVSQGWLGRGRPWFDAQLLSGYAPSGQQLATLVVTVSHRNLVFFAEEDGFRASYRVRAVVKSRRGSVSAQEWIGSVHVDSYDETRSSTIAEKTVQLDVDGTANDGRRHVVVSLSVEGTQRKSALTLAYEPAELTEGGVSIAETQFYLLRAGQPAPSGGVLQLGEKILPDAKRFVRAPFEQFDLSTGEPWLWVRAFDLRAMPREPLALRVRSGQESPPWNQELDLAGQSVESSYLIRVPATALRFGKNDLHVELSGSKPRRMELLNLGLDLRDGRSWEANLAHVEALATADEFEGLRRAPAEERAAAWKAFWRRRDPTPELSGNERLDEHYRRVAYARRNLRDGVREGGISDRGRVYIQYGPPDSIEDVTSRSDIMTSWQLWRYPALGVIYYFRLVHGGHYRLAWSESY